MFEKFKGMGCGIQDCHGEEVKEGNTIRWMAEDGECYKGIVEFGDPQTDASMFLSGFAVFTPTNITDEVLNDDGELIGDWNGEVEIVKGGGQQ